MTVKYLYNHLLLFFCFAQIDQESKHTDTRKFANQSIEILKGAANNDPEVNKKINDILKGK